MEYLAYLTIPAAIILFAFIIRNGAFKENKSIDENKFVIRQPRSTLLLGIAYVFIFGAFIILLTIYLDDVAEWWAYIIFIALFLIGAFIVLICSFWEVRISGDEIHYRSFFGKRKTYSFSEIEDAKHKNPNSRYQGIALYLKQDHKKLLTVASSCPGFDVLVSRLKSEGITFR